MLNAFAITKLLLDDEQPVDSAAVPPDNDPDPEKLLATYISGKVPFMVPGVPVNLWPKWTDLLGGRSRLKTDRNTYLEKLGSDRIGLKFHNTYVVTVDSTNKVTVDTDGFHSRSTLDRINTAAPGGWGLFGRKPRHVDGFEWNFFWCNYSVKAGSWGDLRQFPFTDGDTIMPDGTLVMQAQPVYPTPRRKRVNPDA